MDKFHIKKISEIDAKKLLQFYQDSFHYEKSILDNHSWRYRLGFTKFEPLVLVINNRICGHAGLIPIDLKINGKCEQAIWFTDFYINPEYRSKGYGKLLADEWMKICPIKITICNDQSLKVFKKLKWASNNKFVRRLKFYNYFNVIPSFRKYSNSTYVLGDLENLKFQELDNKTIMKIIDLNEQNLNKKSVNIIRNESWFKWRILDCPYKKDIYIFNFEETFFITHIKSKNNLKFLNVIYSSEPITSNIAKIFLEFSRKNSIDYLSYVSNQKKIFDFFKPWQRKLNFAFYTKEKATSDLISGSFDNIQFIDSDIDYV